MEEYYYVPLKENQNTFVLSHNGSYKTYNEDFSLVNGHQTYKFTIEILGVTYGFVHPMTYTEEIELFGKKFRNPKYELLYFPIMIDGSMKKSVRFYSQEKSVDALCKLIECIGFDVVATSKNIPIIAGRKCSYLVYSYGHNSCVYVRTDVMDTIKKNGFESLDIKVKEKLYCEPVNIEECVVNGIPKNDAITFRWNDILCTKVYRNDIGAYVYYKSRDILMQCIELGIVKYNYIKSISDKLYEELAEKNKKKYKKTFIELRKSLNNWIYSKDRPFDTAIVHNCIIKAVSEVLRCGITI